MSDFEFKGWKNEGTLRAVFINGAGNVKCASPEIVESDFWFHVGVEQGIIEKTSRTVVLNMEEARIARSTLDLFHG